MDNFEQVRSHVLRGEYAVSIQQPYVICVELSLHGGARRQSVYLSELRDDDDRGLLRVSTVVAAADKVEPRRALSFNWQTRTGYLALGELEDGAFVQLCENRPYRSLDGAGLDRLILEIGGMGDRLEQALAGDGGLDVL